MTSEELQLIDEKFKGLTSLMNAHFENMDDRLEKIEIQTTKTNGRVTALEKKEISHVIDCPLNQKVRTLEDNQLTNAAIKKWIYTSIGVTGTVVAIVLTLLKIFTGVI